MKTMSEKETKIKKNCSTIFLVIGLGLDPKGLKSYGFVNSYISDPNYKDLTVKNPVYLLFKVEDLFTFNQFVEECREQGLPLMAEYSYGDDYEVLLFSFPDEYEEDYAKFLLGQYSKFSEKYKALFPMKTEEKTLKPSQPSLWFNVFNRTKFLRDEWEERIGQALPEDSEYWTTPDLEKGEILTLPQ